MKPLILKLGALLAISAAGFLVSLLRSRSKPRRRPPLPLPSPPLGDEVDSCGKMVPLIHGCTGGGLKDDLFALKSEEAPARIINGVVTPISKSSGNDDGFLLPEFNQIVAKEFEAAGKEQENKLAPPMIASSDSKEDMEMEQEISRLHHLVWSLRERERKLEMQLLEYYGLKEQDEAVKELQNRLKLNIVEVQLLSMKLEALQTENQKLRSQVADYSKLNNELEAAKVKINLLKRMVKPDGEQPMEKIAALSQKVAMLQDCENKYMEDEAGMKRRMEELEQETANLHIANSQLVEENSKLQQMFESTKMTNSSVLDSSEEETMKEANQLREENEKLKKDIEQLQTDRYADVEELVYLRWINACLRYELRNYQPPPGSAIARDLSKKLSPISEAKAKQLILQYANSGIDERSINLADFDSDIFSSAPQAYNGEFNTSSNVFSACKPNSPRKSKFFSKLKKLVLGKDQYHSRASSVDIFPTGDNYSERRASTSSYSSDEMYESSSSYVTAENAPSEQQKRTGHRRSHAGYSSDFKSGSRILTAERCKSDLGTLFGNRSVDDVPEKARLKKFAEVLQSSHGKNKSHKRAISLTLS